MVERKSVSGMQTVKKPHMLNKYVLPFLSLWILIRCVRSMLREKYEPEIWGYILDGRNKTTYPLTHWENMLGRTRNADVHLTNRSVQRVHGVLIRDDNGKWKITINNEGIATIKAQGSSSRNWMQYNSNNSLFACYSGAQQDIYLYTNHKQSPSSSTSQSIADITGSDVEEASATKVYVPAGKLV